MKKRPKDRSQNDFYQISRHLENTDLYINLKKSIADEVSLNKIELAIANNLEVEKLPKNQVVFRNGEIGDKFFMVLLGKVSVLRPTEIEYELTPLQYMMKLVFLLKNNETLLLNKTLSKNLSIYNFDIKDLVSLKDMIFRNKFIKLQSQTPNLDELKNLLKEFNKDLMRDFNLDIKQLEIQESFLQEFDVDLSDKLAQGLEFYDQKSKHSLIDPNKFSFIEHTTTKNKVTMFEYEYFLSLSTGQNFGDMAFEELANKNRNATIIGEDEVTYLGIISQNVYIDYVLNEKERIKSKEIQFLVENYFFKPVKTRTFIMRFFKEFIHEDVVRDTILFKEKDAIDHIYFIKEGEVELYVNKNLLDIQKFIHSLKMLNKDDLGDDYNTLNGKIILLMHL